MSGVAAHTHGHGAEAPAAPVRLDVRAQILIFFSLILIGVSTPPRAWPAFVVYYAFVLAWVIALRIPLLLFVKRAAVAVPFVLMVGVFVPFLKREAGDTLYPVLGGLLHVSSSGLWVLANTALKGVLGVAALVTLSAANPFQTVLSGLQWYRAPRALVQIAGFMYRYLFVISEELQRMARARDARGYRGRWLWQARVIGQMIGALFLRSYERAERIYAAMVSRGYDGEIPETALPRPEPAHMVFAGACVAALICVRLLLKG